MNRRRFLSVLTGLLLSGLARVPTMVGLSVANVLNLHAILVGGLRIAADALGAPVTPALYPHRGMPPESYGFSWPAMPTLHRLDFGAVLIAIALVGVSCCTLTVQVVRLALHDRGPVAAAHAAGGK